MVDRFTFAGLITLTIRSCRRSAPAGCSLRAARCEEELGRAATLARMLAIAFEGCACRAAFHAGVSAALAEAGMGFALAAGSSSGSLCAAGVAAGRATQM